MYIKATKEVIKKLEKHEGKKHVGFFCCFKIDEIETRHQSNTLTLTFSPVIRVGKIVMTCEHNRTALVMYEINYPDTDITSSYDAWISEDRIIGVFLNSSIQNGDKIEIIESEEIL